MIFDSKIFYVMFLHDYLLAYEISTVRTLALKLEEGQNHALLQSFSMILPAVLKCVYAYCLRVNMEDCFFPSVVNVK